MGGPNLACIHAGGNCIRLKEPHVDVQPVGEVMLLYKVFDAESTSCEWT